MQLAVLKLDAVCSGQPEEEEADDQVDYEDYTEEGAASVGFEHCDGVEGIVEHHQEDGDGSCEVLLDDAFFFGYFYEPNEEEYERQDGSRKKAEPEDEGISSELSTDCETLYLSGGTWE